MSDVKIRQNQNKKQHEEFKDAEVRQHSSSRIKICKLPMKLGITCNKNTFKNHFYCMTEFTTKTTKT